MLKAISIWAIKDFDKRPARSLCSEVKAHGFDALELSVGESGLLTPDSDEATCAKLVRTASEEGLRISSLATGMGWQFPMSSTDPGVREKGIEVVKRSLRIGGWLGVDCLLVVPGLLSSFDAKGGEHVPYDVAYENMRAAIPLAIAAAEEARVIIGIENVWNKVLLSPLEMRDFIDSFGTKWVGAYLDVGNMIVTGYAEDWVRVLGERIGCVHFKDFKREVGTISGFCDLLEGDVNYPEVMKSLREAGYDGPCVAEFFGLDSKALGRVSKAMDRIFAM
jgi:hexulose-6-phosphate isomerase